MKRRSEVPLSVGIFNHKFVSFLCIQDVNKDKAHELNLEGDATNCTLAVPKSIEMTHSVLENQFFLRLEIHASETDS